MWAALMLVVLACSACDLVLGLEARPDSTVVADATIDAPPDAAACPTDYVQLGSLPHVYRLDPDPASWAAAELDCENDSMNLTHLATPVDVSQLDVLRTAFPTGRIWVGIGRSATAGWDEFRTLTNVAVPRGPMWETNEPSTMTGNDRFAELLETGRLNDVPVTFMNRYVCVCDLRPITPL